MRTITRATVALLVAGIALTSVGAAAGAQDDDTGDVDNLVVITGRAEVHAGETVDNVFIVHGPVTVDGTVREALVAVNGDVLVHGTVEDDVVVVDGRVTVADGGRIEGDVVSRNRPIVQGGGRVEGTWEKWDPGAWSGLVSVVGWLAMWLAVTVSTLVLGLVLGLLAPRAAAAVDEAFDRGAGPVVLWGLVLLIGLPVAAVIAMVTLVGFPLGLVLLLALGLIYGIGYVAGAFVLGSRVVRTASPVVRFLVGWGILRAIALIPFLGGLVSLAATVVGLGALAVAGRAARRGRVEARAPGEPAVPPAPPPPSGPPPSPTPSAP